MDKLFYKTGGFILFSTLLLSSCNTHEKLVYFQEKIPTNSEVNTSNYTPTFKTDDLLSIKISGDDPEASIPFNLIDLTATTTSGYSSGSSEKVGYLINNEGNVHIPVLGEIKLIGLSRIQATQLIQDKMKSYVSNPVVNIQILNFKISVLGDVKKPGTFKIPNERITLLEAIGLSGDLNITGNRKNVLVIRDIEGVKEEFRIDLTSVELFNSKAYYLEQNDVVYVEPNKAARTQSTLWKTSGGIFISLTALIITTVTLIVK